MGGQVIAAAACAAAGAAWAVRGRSSHVFGPSVWRGPRDRRAIALTFDDGPSESTPKLLDVLAGFGISATFFVCGIHVRRLPAVLREEIAAGHEIGNHTENHAHLWWRSPAFIRDEIGRAQESIREAASREARLFRAPYGVRWPGVGAAQREFGLLGVMWTAIGRDWALPASDVAARSMRSAENGAILCLHDGRERQLQPDIGVTVEAVREIVPRLIDAGFEFRTVSELIG